MTGLLVLNMGTRGCHMGVLGGTLPKQHFNMIIHKYEYVSSKNNPTRNLPQESIQAPDSAHLIKLISSTFAPNYIHDLLLLNHLCNFCKKTTLKYFHQAVSIYIIQKRTRSKIQQPLIIKSKRQRQNQ